MFSDDYEQEQSLDSFLCMPIDSTNSSIKRDEASEIIANMTKTLHVNTPELTMNVADIDDFDDNSNDDILSNRPQLIGQLKTHLVHNQMQRTQTRDYLRILGESNTPAYWYKSPPKNRSVYFYDPNYQKYVQQRSNSPEKIKPNTRSIPRQPLRLQERSFNHSSFLQNSSFPVTPRTKYIVDLYNTAANYHQQKQRLNKNHHLTSSNISQQPFSTSSRLQSIPKLPPINTTKQWAEQQYNFSNTNEKNYQTIRTELRKNI